MSSNFLVVSNNPQVWAHESVNCVRISETPLQVLYKGLDYLAEGLYTFYAHPVAGNERLLRNPFRSIILQKKDTISVEKLTQQIRFVEYYLRKLEYLDFSRITQSELEDYRIVDYELFMATCPLREKLLCGSL